MKAKHIISIAALLSAAGVGLGAFGAHGLKDLLVANQQLETFKTAANYHLIHALALFITGVLAKQQMSSRLSIAAYFFCFGIVIFSGSLYILSITGVRWLGAITPIGGVLFIIAWLSLAWDQIANKY